VLSYKKQHKPKSSEVCFERCLVPLRYIFRGKCGFGAGRGHFFVSLYYRFPPDTGLSSPKYH